MPKSVKRLNMLLQHMGGVNRASSREGATLQWVDEGAGDGLEQDPRCSYPF